MRIKQNSWALETWGTGKRQKLKSEYVLFLEGSGDDEGDDNSIVAKESYCWSTKYFKLRDNQSHIR